jgi:hypothetical protein
LCLDAQRVWGLGLVCCMCMLQVHFQPQEAAAFRVAAACSLDNGELVTVQVMYIHARRTVTAPS